MGEGLGGPRSTAINSGGGMCSSQLQLHDPTGAIPRKGPCDQWHMTVTSTRAPTGTEATEPEEEGWVMEAKDMEAGCTCGGADQVRPSSTLI
ncbi:hypothetical protein Pcinc_025813 [Petrolisthes cinctipes]|uniref:Uncharacterized protein n=1 Tax=Petrolisthes cinctipes TaxID=88211 RepID=A0AAE1F8E2_PETCI|nr:hypothetical protein Pcinc_025813 [Petrolisthes cinctipes]